MIVRGHYFGYLGYLRKLTVKQTRQDYKQGYRKIAGNVETKYHYDYIWLFGKLYLVKLDPEMYQ